MMLVYCETCGFRIAPEDLERGAAVQVEENRYLCAKCNPNKTPSQEIKAARSTPSQIRIPRQTPKAPAPAPRPPSSPLESRGLTEAVKSSGGTAIRKAPKEKGLPLPVLAGLGAASALLIVWLVWPAQKPVVPVAPVASTDEIRTIDKVPTVSPPVTPPEPPPKSNAPIDRVMPSWMQKGGGPDVGPRRPSTQPQREEGDSTIFFDDALPPKAEENGTANVRFISWKWIPKPGPVFSGDYSHTISGEPIEKIHQHYFEDANPPLLLTEQDILFAYVYIDPAAPPKTIMMQWNVNKNWEHRAYWGENKIEFGRNETPSRRPMGPLPKFGEWVRLEVPAAHIGLSGNGIAISGCSFDHFGGRVYWDKVGVQRKSSKPGAASAPPTATPAVATTPDGLISLGKVAYNAISGGREHPNFMGKNFTGKAIWAKPTPLNTLSATFQAADGKYGAGALSLFCLRHGRKEPCRMALSVNGTTILDGVDASEQREWRESRYPIPEGVLKPGPNEIRIQNLEENGGVGGDPWIMVHSIELFATPAK